MKIEIGESLLYSWLRHAKGCQIVQTNWKPSIKSWELHNEEMLQSLMEQSSNLFQNEYEAKVFKGNSSLSQLLQQAEIDVLGISFDGTDQSFYAIDVAFHEAGLNYGSKEETVMRVIKKIIRSALCVSGFFDIKKGQLIFASPKIHNAVLFELDQRIPMVQNIFDQAGLNYTVRVIANNDFDDKILQPVVAATSIIADTTELFMRSMQMYNLFAIKPKNIRKPELYTTSNKRNNDKGALSNDVEAQREKIEITEISGLEEMKIGAVVRSTLPSLLEDEVVTKEEVELMQTAGYSKAIFDIQYPLLQKARLTEGKKPHRYWAWTVSAYGEDYFICSEWYETVANNDRPYYLKWLKDKLKEKAES